MPYDAFISYSHDADRPTARAVQIGLQQLAKPWYRRRALRVFRDESNLSASPSLWSSIQQALESSRFLILIASPAAARSPWVNREIEEWRSTKGSGQILIVVATGNWGWDPKAGDLSADSDAVPPALRGSFDAEPFYLDLRTLPDVSGLTLRHSAFRNAIASLASPLHGRDKDTLEGDHIREHRRAIRLAWGAMSCLAVLAIAAAIASLLAVNNARRAAERARVAQARQLAVEAVGLKDGRLDLALLLALESRRVASITESKASLMTVLNAQQQIAIYLRGHSSTVLDLAFSPNDAVLASAGDDGRLVLWDSGSGQPAVLAERSTGFTSVDFSGDGRWLAAGNRDGTVLVWDLSAPSAQERTLRVSSDGAVFDVAFQPGQQRLAVGGALDSVQLWDLTTASLKRRLGKFGRAELHGIWSITFSQDGRLLAAMQEDRTVHVWSVDTGIELPGPPPGGEAPHLGRVVFGAGGVLAEPRQDGTVHLWDTAAGRRGPVLGQPLTSSLLRSFGGVLALAYNPASHALATANFDGTVTTWDLSSRKLLHDGLRGHRDAAWSVAFSHDGRFLATGDAKGTIIAWSVLQRRSLGLLIAHTAGSSAVAFSPDGRVIASGTGNGSVVLSLAETGEPLMDPLAAHDTTVVDLAFRPDGKVLVSVDADGRAVSWDLARTPPSYAPIGVDAQALRAVAYSPDSIWLALGGAATISDPAGNHGAVFLFDAVTLRAKGPPVYADAAMVQGIAFSPSGSRLVAAGDDGRATLWDIASRTQVQKPVGDEFGRLFEVAYHPGGHLVAVGRSVPEIGVWDFDRRAAHMEPLAGHRDAVLALAFSPDGRTLASGSTDGTIRLWDVERGLALGGPLDQLYPVFDLSYSPDGAKLASAGPEGVAVWDLSDDNLTTQGCYIANRNLTRAEWTLYLAKVSPTGGPVHHCPTARGSNRHRIDRGSLRARHELFAAVGREPAVRNAEGLFGLSTVIRDIRKSSEPQARGARGTGKRGSLRQSRGPGSRHQLLAPASQRRALRPATAVVALDEQLTLALGQLPPLAPPEAKAQDSRTHACMQAYPTSARSSAMTRGAPPHACCRSSC